MTPFAPQTDAPLIIGKRYKVPCVWAQWGSSKFAWLPVLGPKHDDADIIGFEPQHYHIDARFLAPRAYDARTERHYRGSLGITGVPIHEPYPNRTNRHAYNIAGIAPPVLRWRTYWREWPIAEFIEATLRPRGWMTKLEAAYACARLKGMICPHRGADLSSMPVVDGKVTCPLHGLRWNVETGEIAPHDR